MVHFQRHVRDIALASCLCAIAVNSSLIPAARAASVTQIGFVDKEIPSGSMDGINLTFLTSEPPVPSSSLAVYRNGLRMFDQDYSSTGNVIVFKPGQAPALGDTLFCSYRVAHAVLANWSVGKPASQSSAYFGAFAGATAAVDGNTDGYLPDGSVTHTSLETSPWWQVDLGSSITVSSVVVWNRTDCCSSRLSDYWVFVSNTPFATSDTPATLQNRAATWSNHQTVSPSPVTSIVVGGAQGQYVRVQLTGADYLSLAEVQVIGTLP